MLPKTVLAVASLVFAACASDGGGGETTDNTPPMTPSAPLPQVSGSYAARYLVPVPAELADAANYLVDHVDWEVEAGTINLHYDLPDGLVGGLIPVALSGSLAAAATSVEVAGDNATGLCVATTTTVTCREDFFGLGSLPLSTTVVTERAALEYAGPAADRQAVAGLFDADPIGFVEIDLESPVVDDHGSDR